MSQDPPIETWQTATLAVRIGEDVEVHRTDETDRRARQYRP